ncbi:MAG TPA: serine/threonine-protein kinase [Anaeromyxobacteraceae bacterium]|nr:serine/threonine-protein kinase [Anaeromyxobacteraceae bacterium]
MAGRVLGDRYRVLRRIGEGGMGAVYLCEHVVLRRRLAVKVLRPELAADPEIVERFRQEAVAASQIGQENVVDVLDFGNTEEGALFYVMEALEGLSLGAVLRREGPLAIARALAILEQICRALAAAHRRGVVHRDLKPDNVFLVRRDDGVETAKLLDFGISKVEPDGLHARLTRAGAIIGTPEYMAPEQAAGGAVDHRADMYALGVMAYEMLTGTLPLEGGTAIATLVAHQTMPPQAPSRRRAAVPPEIDAVVLRALAKRPDDRFESMAALGGEIARIRARLGGVTPEAFALRQPGGDAMDRQSSGDAARQGVATRPSGRGATVALGPEASGEVRRASAVFPPVRPRRRRALAVAAAVVALASAAGAGWWLRGERGARDAAPWPGPFPRPGAPSRTAGVEAAPSDAPPPTAPEHIAPPPRAAAPAAPAAAPPPRARRSAASGQSVKPHVAPAAGEPAGEPADPDGPAGSSGELKPSPF